MTIPMIPGERFWLRLPGDERPNVQAPAVEFRVLSARESMVLRRALERYDEAAAGDDEAAALDRLADALAHIASGWRNLEGAFTPDGLLNVLTRSQVLGLLGRAYAFGETGRDPADAAGEEPLKNSDGPSSTPPGGSARPAAAGTATDGPTT